MPPKDVAPSKLWAKLQETPAPSEVVDFPRKRRDGNPVDQLRIMVIPQYQHDVAREAAARAMERRKWRPEQLQNELLAEVQGDLTAKEILALACHEVEPIPGSENDPKYPRIFANGEQVGHLTADEIEVLFTQYLMVKAKYGPYIRDLSEDELNEWIRVLGDGGGTAFPLASFSSEDLVRLCMSMAQRSFELTSILFRHSNLLSISESDLERLTAGISSFGEQPDDGSESNPEPTPESSPLPSVDDQETVDQVADKIRRNTRRRKQK